MAEDARDEGARLTPVKPEPTFDVDGYPTDATVEVLREWPTDDAAGALDFLKAAWCVPYGSVTHTISAHEGYVLHAKAGEKYLRLATGGWSGNELLVGTFRYTSNSYMTWRLSAAGGLFIFRYPA